ncbi:uncharacterized protein V1516DRAFT_619142 [Lipomyces oligophaga]|uniref:uncharacterized protein n=1 Tax=Lipomyces oligophaga TaxID=45792 RepID=UPI0034CFE947
MAKVVFITGATGLLGLPTLNEFTSRSDWHVVGTGFDRVDDDSLIKLDLTDFQAVTKSIIQVQPSIIIHTAGERSLEVSQQDIEYTEKLNVAVTLHLAELSKNLDIPLIYISSDYVFDGTKPPYEPDDVPNPSNEYGELKLRGERAALDTNPKAIVLRLPVLYGATEYESESAINCLIDVVMNREQKLQAVIDDWQLLYPTNTTDTARVIYEIAGTLILQAMIKSLTKTERSIAGQLTPQILHFSADQRFTKYAICVILGEILCVPITHLVRQNTAPTMGVKLPYNCKLSVHLLETVGIDIASVDFQTWFRKYLLPRRR